MLNPAGKKIEGKKSEKSFFDTHLFASLFALQSDSPFHNQAALSSAALRSSHLSRCHLPRLQCS
jgi:hypothetical protein